MPREVTDNLYYGYQLPRDPLDNTVTFNLNGYTVETNVNSDVFNVNFNDPNLSIDNYRLPFTSTGVSDSFIKGYEVGTVRILGTQSSNELPRSDTNGFLTYRGLAGFGNRIAVYNQSENRIEYYDIPTDNSPITFAVSFNTLQSETYVDIARNGSSVYCLQSNDRLITVYNSSGARPAAALLANPLPTSSSYNGIAIDQANNLMYLSTNQRTIEVYRRRANEPPNFNNWDIVRQFDIRTYADPESTLSTTDEIVGYNIEFINGQLWVAQHLPNNRETDSIDDVFIYEPDGTFVRSARYSQNSNDRRRPVNGITFVGNRIYMIWGFSRLYGYRMDTEASITYNISDYEAYLNNRRIREMWLNGSRIDTLTVGA